MVYLQIKKEVVVTIVDHGCGMDEETKKHIFERFYQGETSHNKEGNGLGLTIVTKILQLCNQKLTKALSLQLNFLIKVAKV